MVKKIGIFGGTFNPPHRGHLLFAGKAVEALSLSLMLIIPAKQPPHKKTEGDVSFDDRLEMTRLAFRDSPLLEVSDIEGMREGPSFTIDTIRALSRRFPDACLFLFIGADMLVSFESWKSFEEIFAGCVIVVSSRIGGDRGEVESKIREFSSKYKADIRLLDFEPLEISSTDIRRMLGEGQDASKWLSASVLDYIDRRRLYEKKTSSGKGAGL